MVIRLGFVSLIGIVFVSIGGAKPASGAADRAWSLASDHAPDPDRSIKSALGREDFPWYDAKNDQVRPIELPATGRPNPSEDQKSRQSDPPRDRKSNEPFSGWEWGDYLVFGGFVVALAALVGLVIRFWKRFEPTVDTVTDASRPAAPSRNGEALPADLRRDGATEDPWVEANRRRLAGDHAGAILCLFAHQLLTLSRLGLVRLAPGRTGRQLHRAVVDPEFRALMRPTLRQFEAVYYGHRTPSPGDFAAVWTSAEAFERRAAEGVAG